MMLGCGVEAPEATRLGMNDVTILVPLPADVGVPRIANATDLAADGTALVPQALFDRIVISPNNLVDIDEKLPAFHLVALRFDLCDRDVGECAVGEDGRFRVVFQPLANGKGAADIALHAFYSIPAARVPEVVDELRALAALQGSDDVSLLRVNPALVAGNEAYVTRLRALFLATAGATSLQRLTFFAVPRLFPNQPHWHFRGLEREAAGTFALMKIPETGTQEQLIIVSAATTYDVLPIGNASAGFKLAVSTAAFTSAPAAAQRDALEALVAIDNPMVHGGTTVQCASCHATTRVLPVRASALGIDPQTVVGRYTSPFDLSVAAGNAMTRDNFMRCLGYFGTEVLISQRVVNETAQVLTEIANRYRDR
jgi:hypothetical protein